MSYIFTGLSETEKLALKLYAVRKGKSMAELTAQAIRTSPHTKQAFQPKEDSK